MELNEKEAVVKQELKQLLVDHSLAETGSADDEIVLGYVLGVLEYLPPVDDLDDGEDVYPFADTMEAYLPGFSAISLPDIGEWMVNTAMKLSQSLQPDISKTSGPPIQHQDEDISTSPSSSDKSSDHIIQINTKDAFGPITKVLFWPDSKDTFHSNTVKTVKPQSEKQPLKPPSVDKGAEARGEKRIVQVQRSDSDSMDALRELCPAASTAELQHCLHMCEGNVEEAAYLLLCRQESDTAITKKSAEVKSRKKNSKPVYDLQDDESLKDSILAKYSWVDTSEDKTEHRPELFVKEQKKMIRYREGQVVSTKGERFSEIKKPESDEMKKTYVNLKPQRKYRFH